MTPTVYNRENLRNPVAGGWEGGNSQESKTQDCKAAGDEPAAGLTRVYQLNCGPTLKSPNKPTMHVETSSPLQPAVGLFDDMRASSLQVGTDSAALK